MPKPLLPAAVRDGSPVSLFLVTPPPEENREYAPVLKVNQAFREEPSLEQETMRADWPTNPLERLSGKGFCERWSDRLASKQSNESRGNYSSPNQSRSPVRSRHSTVASTQEHFSVLLRRVNAEFERLERSNNALVQEMTELRRDTDRVLANSLSEMKANAAQLAQPALSPEDSGSGSCRSSLTGVDMSGSCSAWRAKNVEPLSMVYTPTNSADVIQCQKNFSLHKQPRPAAAGLQELAMKLDNRGDGRLRFEDLVSLLRKHGEPFSFEKLAATVELLNSLGDTLEAAALIWEAPTDPLSVSDDHYMLDHDILTCLASLQKVCKMETVTGGVRPRRALSNFGPRKGGCTSTPSVVPEKSVAPELTDTSSVMSVPRWVPPVWLEVIPTTVILMNILVTGLSADYEEHETIWDALETSFVAFYAVEFVLKMRIYGPRGYCCGPERLWNAFDVGCLIMSIPDTGLRILLSLLSDEEYRPELRGLLLVKIFRLARLARLVRTLRFKIFYELKLMVLGVFSGLRVLTWAIVLLVCLTYLVGVALTLVFQDREMEFASVTSSMFTLFRCWTDGCARYDGTPLPEHLRREHGLGFMVFHVLITMFVTVGVFNLIMAIFIDNVVTNQNLRKSREMANRSHMIEQRFKRLFTMYIKTGVNPRFGKTVMQRLQRTLSSMAEVEMDMRSSIPDDVIESEFDLLRRTDVRIPREMFNIWLEDDDFQQLLDEAEIELPNPFELFDILDTNMDGELSMEELTVGLMKLRGPVTKADIVSVRLKVRHVARVLETVTPLTFGRSP